MLAPMGSWLESWMAASSASPALVQAGYLTTLGIACAVVYVVARVWIVGAIRRFARRSESRWDDALVDSDVFVRLAHFAPALVAFYGVQAIPELAPGVQVAVQRAAIAVMVIVAALSAGAFLSATNEIYVADPENRRRPIKGYLQVVKIVLYVLSGLSIVSVLLDRSPWIFVSGIGALSAVLLLIFKDTILSLVASIQITNNDMVHVGDWVEMPRYGADGDVVDVALHTVKVQNWDKTITTIPTHALIADSFKNWRGMSESGGRRIKRCLHIDVNSIRFLEPEEVERFGRWSLLREYVAAKKSELEEYNARVGRDSDARADLRNLTNVGTLRAYIRAYLQASQNIHPGMTLLVRQLPPGPEGLPIELYCFTNVTEWGAYEEIQSDLFDHILAIVPEFDLRIFQNPSGADLEQLGAVGGT
jgi:miniconductance mechanosensitive channel